MTCRCCVFREPLVTERQQRHQEAACAGPSVGPAAMRIVQVSGDSGSGKTTLMELLLPRLKARGLRVGTIKHAHHGFEMDREGKDSWRHMQAGAEAVTVVSPRLTAILLRTKTDLNSVQAAARMEGHADVVLVEGFRRESGPSIRFDLQAGARLQEDSRGYVLGVRPLELTTGELDTLVRFVEGNRGAVPLDPDSECESGEETP